MDEREVVEALIRKAKEVADLMKAHVGVIRLITHYDTDGIVSGAIMIEALARLGKEFHLSVVKQLDRKTIEKLSEEKYGLIVFLDLGSGQVGDIEEKLKDKKIIVVDHHQVQGEPVSIVHLNPLDFGISENISGSGVSYLVARAFSAKNRDLSELAIIGAVGDSQIGSVGDNWGLLGLNKEILKDAVATKKIRVGRGLRLWGRSRRPVHKALEYSMELYIPGITGSESGSVQFLQEMGIKLKKENGEWRTLSDLSEEEQKKLATGIIKERIRGNEEYPQHIFGDVYDMPGRKDFNDVGEFATIINAMGKSMKAWIGIALCLKKPGVAERVNAVYENYRKDIGKALGWFEENRYALKERRAGYYLLAGGHIPEHIISNIVSILANSEFSIKPIFAFADTEDGDVKVSARASDELVEKGMNLMEVVREAARAVEGEGGGHRGAAGGTIPKGSEEKFISIVEEILGKGKSAFGLPKAEGVGEHGNKTDTETDGKEIERERGSKEREAEGKKEANKKEKGNKKMEGKGLVRYFEP